MKALGYNVGTVSPTFLCKLFEDNSGALTLAQDPAINPRTKHINAKYHNFPAYVDKSPISNIPTESSKLPADMLMHPLS